MKNNTIIRKNVKLVLLGDHQVGKTSIMDAFDNFEFKEETLSTIGIDKHESKFINYKGRDFKVFFFDTSGQERFLSISLTSLKVCDGIILVYSVKDKKSFQNIENFWMNQISDLIDVRQKSIILVGNKYDDFTDNENFVSKEEGIELAKRLNIPFFECSAKTKLNIKEMINMILESCIEKKIKQKEEEDRQKFYF